MAIPSQLLKLEERVGNASDTAQLLGVAEKGSYYPWKKATRPIPIYIKNSIEAHLALSDRAFAKRVQSLHRPKKDMQILHSSNT